MIGMVFLSFFIAMVLGLPLALGMGVAALVPNLVDSSFVGNLDMIINSIVSGLNTTSILAIPLFILSGILMTKGGISQKLFDVFAIMIGKRTAGIPCAVIITCLFYGAVSGSGPATAAAVGAMAIPLMIDLGYDKVFSAALIATAGGLGVIIPPSIPFILYGIYTNTSVGDLFVAGVLPGCLIAFCLMTYAYIYCRKHGEDKEKIAENYEKLKKLGFFKVIKNALWALLTPVIILGGIYGGVVTPTEAACVSVFYALIVCLFIYRTIRISDIPGILRDAISTYAPICFLCGVATALLRILVLLDATGVVTKLINSTVSNKFTLLFILNILFLIVGMFMNVSDAVIIVAPIIVPIAQTYGISPVHMGIVMVVNMAIGFVTPPFGMNLFVAAPMIDSSVEALGRKAMPFIAAFIVALCLITIFPSISLCLL